jgi:hypothetical protein
MGVSLGREQMKDVKIRRIQMYRLRDASTRMAAFVYHSSWFQCVPERRGGVECPRPWRSVLMAVLTT